MTTFVITGSTKGIGFALAKYAAGRGDNVVVSGRTAAAVDEAVARIEPGAAGKVLGVAADTSELAQVEALWARATERFGRVDVWINNAGIANMKPILEIADTDVQAMLRTNMLGTIHGCQVAARGMVKQGGGRIFNILGGGSDGEYFPGMGVYGATKRGLDYFTRALVKELAGTPVLVGRVRPGMIVTEGVIREIKADPAGFAKGRKVMNALCDLPDTVAPYLVEKMLAMPKTGGKIAWLTGGKIALRMMLMGFKPRADLYQQAAGI